MTKKFILLSKNFIRILKKGLSRKFSEMMFPKKLIKFYLEIVDIRLLVISWRNVLNTYLSTSWSFVLRRYKYVWLQKTYLFCLKKKSFTKGT